MISEQQKMVIQGIEGSYHHLAALQFKNGQELQIVPANSFDQLAVRLSKDPEIKLGLIAIENSIAGSILQNYRILREYKFWITGEIYLQIHHQLMALPGQKIKDIHELKSHPMAIHQSLDFLKQHPHIRLIETEDTAMSAKEISEQALKGTATIASSLAANLYDLNILAKDIETSKVNYTRFFIIQKNKEKVKSSDNTKASIYVRVKHQRGSLLMVLKQIYKHGVNMTKLQSYPVIGKMNEYFFHIDLVFESLSQYEVLMKDLIPVTEELEELGVYQRAYYKTQIDSIKENSHSI